MTDAAGSPRGKAITREALRFSRRLDGAEEGTALPRASRTLSNCAMDSPSPNKPDRSLAGFEKKRKRIGHCTAGSWTRRRPIVDIALERERVGSDK